MPPQMADNLKVTDKGGERIVGIQLSNSAQPIWTCLKVSEALVYVANTERTSISTK